VGFLDDLKRQAESLREQQDQDSASLQRNTEAVEAACKTALRYLNTLSAQLDTLQPASPARFRLDRKHSFEQLKLTDFYVDARRRLQPDGEQFDHVLMHWQLKTGQKLVLVKDFIAEIEQLESRLRQSGADTHHETVRHPDTGKLIEMRYTVSADFRGSVRITPRHAAGRLQFLLQNLDGFETITFELPAGEVNDARLDELARWLAGHPHGFLKGAEQLRRVEA
jgi:hypothetical protein